MTNESQPQLLVTGASGQLGRRVIFHLIHTFNVQPDRVIATTRKPDALADLAEQGVVVRSADFNDPASLGSAFTGASRMLLISTDALDVPGRRLAQHKRAVEAAIKADVDHIVYTSMPKPEPGSPIPFAPDHYSTEQDLASSGLGWTVLRNNWYSENLFASIPRALSTGKWYTSAGEGRVAYVTREDCARSAAAVLASNSRDNARYEVTGPEALGVTDIAKIAGDLAGLPIEVVHVSDQQLAAGLSAAGVPAPFVSLLTAFDANTRANNVSAVSDTVFRLTGRAPTTVTEFLRENLQALNIK